MPTYLVQVSYSVEALAALVKKPQNRTEPIRKAIEKIGGKLKGLWLSFGDQDVVGIFEMPDSTGAAAFAMAIGAGGACRSVKTTQLMEPDEGVVAMKKAAASGYKPVSTKR
jgi:uncharacterized protein with GYD domain